MRAGDALLLIVDVQQRLAPAIADAATAVRNTSILLAAAKRLSLPTLVSEQYPKGLGTTIEPLREHLSAQQIIEKTHFSCTAEPAVLARIQDAGRRQIVLTGMETHVCVLQTALGLIEAGFDVFAVEDAVGSRTERNKQLGIERMRAAGANIVSTEMVVFEWLHRAGTPEFKELSALIK